MNIPDRVQSAQKRIDSLFAAETVAHLKGDLARAIVDHMNDAVVLDRRADNFTGATDLDAAGIESEELTAALQAIEPHLATLREGAEKLRGQKEKADQRTAAAREDQAHLDPVEATRSEFGRLIGVIGSSGNGRNPETIWDRFMDLTKAIDKIDVAGVAKLSGLGRVKSDDLAALQHELRQLLYVALPASIGPRSSSKQAGLRWIQKIVELAKEHGDPNPLPNIATGLAQIPFMVRRSMLANQPCQGLLKPTFAKLPGEADLDKYRGLIELLNKHPETPEGRAAAQLLSTLAPYAFLHGDEVVLKPAAAQVLNQEHALLVIMRAPDPNEAVTAELVDLAAGPLFAHHDPHVLAFLLSQFARTGASNEFGKALFHTPDASFGQAGKALARYLVQLVEQHGPPSGDDHDAIIQQLRAITS